MIERRESMLSAPTVIPSTRMGTQASLEMPGMASRYSEWARDVVDYVLLAALEAPAGDAPSGFEPVEHLPEPALRLAPQPVAVQQVHARHHAGQVGEEVGGHPAGRRRVGGRVDGRAEPLHRAAAAGRIRVWRGLAADGQAGPGRASR